MTHNVANVTQELIFKAMFEQIPYNIAVIDKDYNIIQANENFAEYFGNWKKQKCYRVYKKLNEPCKDCPTEEVFK
ncbi:MAG: PAS domain-containing protein, partial [Ignavibacteria bacterium]